MIQIVRDEHGNHTVGGQPFEPRDVQFYHKVALTKATQMAVPFSVQTLEGTMEGKAGDWLMIGASGEMYPCDADIFAKTYEAAVES
ncbi:MAG TPA: hypothetical protein VM537_15755 [Anaerolineae bacterium]|nr:hypothetical protein [Anaerolineae bacterium]